MSGWRSGSGRSVTALDRALADPAAALGTDAHRAGRQNAGLVIVLAIALAIIAVGGIHSASLRPPHRILPAPIHGSVVLVPIGPLFDSRVGELPGNYRDEYGLEMTVTEPIPLASAAWNASRRQYAAHELINALRRLTPGLPSAAEQPLVIGFTRADIYIEGVDWNFAFALRLDERYAVISTARMPNTKTMSRWTLFRKMLTRELGFLAWQLPPTDDRYDLLYRDLLGTEDLDRISDHL